MKSAKFVNYLLCIICTFLEVSGNSKSSTCDINIDSCEYKLTLVPTDQCHGNEIRSRSKRSEDTNDFEYKLEDIVAEMALLQSDFQKLEKKLTKEMKNLSTRVLRGARRLEMMADSSGSHGHHKKKVNCPKGFVTYENWNDCYLFSTFSATWYDAKDYCVAMGSDLVALESLQEHFLVAFYIQNNAEYRTGEGWWTSGTYMPKSGLWMWLTYGQRQPTNYVKWAVNEPNDLHDKDLQCVMMYKLDNLLWHDQMCTDKYNFICESPST